MSEPLTELEGQKGQADCHDCVRDRAMSKACLEIARGGSVIGSDRPVPHTTSSKGRL